MIIFVHFYFPFSVHCYIIIYNKYHIVFAPKFRRKEIYRELKKEIGNILRQLCEWKGVTIIEAHACVYHIYICRDTTKDEYFKFCWIFKR